MPAEISPAYSTISRHPPQQLDVERLARLVADTGEHLLQIAALAALPHRRDAVSGIGHPLGGPRQPATEIGALAVAGLHEDGVTLAVAIEGVDLVEHEG